MLFHIIFQKVQLLNYLKKYQMNNIISYYMEYLMK